MATFQYTALDSKGKEQRGVVEAASQAAAVSAIKDRQLFPTSVTEAVARKAGAPAGGAARKGAGLRMSFKLPSFSTRVKPKVLMIVTRQMSILINAGLPLIRALQVLQRQEKAPLLKKTIGELCEAIQSGSTFAEALGQHPKIFNRLFVNMVRAGEIGGVLDKILDRLAQFMEKAEKIKGKVVSAMVYPIVVLIMAGGILTFLMMVIIPKFQDIFKDLLNGAELPPLTQVVMSISTNFTRHAPFVLGGIVALVVLLRVMRRWPKPRFYMDKFKLNMPLFGTLIRKTAIARFSRTLGTLMASGVNILQALTIVKETSGNEVLAGAIQSVHDAVKEGENVAPPLEATGIFPPMVIGMVEVGEETGELPEMLSKVADSYDEEVDNAVTAITSIIEPLMIIGLALIVGTIVISLFMPLVSIIGSLSK